MRTSVHLSMSLSLVLAVSTAACRSSGDTAGDTAEGSTGGTDGGAAGDTGDGGSATDDCPSLVLDATALRWEDVPLGEPVDATLQLSNLCVGTEPLVVAAALATDSGAGFSGDLDVPDVAPGDSATITLRFTADGYADQEGGLLLVSNDPAQPELEIPLSAGVDPDQDGDGFDASEVGGDDCDDGDAAIHPDATETWYDGVDADCDGASDYDADHDGLDSADYGGDDCDDTDPDLLDTCPQGCADYSDGFPLQVPGNQPTIQDAIDAAVSGDGICVAAGTYVENLDFGGKDVWLLADQGPDFTLISGGGAGSCVQFVSSESADAILDGFTLTGGEATHGGGVYVEGADPTLRNLVVEANTSSEQGAAIFLDAADVTLSSVTITNNHTDWACSGLCLWSGSSAVLQDVDIIDNSSAGWAGGGIYVHEDGELIASNLRILGNQATGSDTGGGGGIIAIGGSIDLSNAIIAGNETEGRGGGIDVNNTVRGMLTNVTITGNTALNGGAVFLRDSSSAFTFHNVIISSNRATDQGDGVMDYGGSNPTFSYTDVYDNDFFGTTPGSASDGNLTTDPGFVSFSRSKSPSSWDLHLSADSDLVDAGDPTISDADGTRSDMGAYGGPYGSWP